MGCRLWYGSISYGNREGYLMKEVVELIVLVTVAVWAYHLIALVINYDKQ